VNRTVVRAVLYELMDVSCRMSYDSWFRFMLTTELQQIHVDQSRWRSCRQWAQSVAPPRWRSCHTDCCCGAAGRHRSTRYRDTAL